MHVHIPNIVFMTVQDPRRNTVNKKHYDYQLLFIRLVQICVYIITTLPFISYLFYSVIKLNWTKSNNQTSIDNFYMIVTYTIVYCNFTSTFYIHILVASIFRKDLKRLLFHNRFMNMMFEIRQNT
jgi:hypothetical protein